MENRHAINPSKIIPARINKVRGVNQFFVAIDLDKDSDLLFIIFPFDFWVEWLILPAIVEEET